MNTRNLPLGDYAASISPKLYAQVPKAGFAAIAVGPAINGGSQVEMDDTPDAYILREWGLLYAQGIVAQRPPKGAK